jgi:hypothetical protein
MNEVYPAYSNDASRSKMEKPCYEKYMRECVVTTRAAERLSPKLLELGFIGQWQQQTLGS